MKYSDYFIDCLVKLGYTHVFFVNGGNVLHLIESARTRMKCIAVVNEVSAGIAAEYFNVANRDNDKRALAIVTAGPGVTNIVTSVAGAWLESRELLVVGGQARTEFLSRQTVRQTGHQEIDGISILDSITKKSFQINKPIKFEEIEDLVNLSINGRKGPVFLEMCLDVSATEVAYSESESLTSSLSHEQHSNYKEVFDRLLELIKKSSRPIFLVGGGLDFKSFDRNLAVLKRIGIPIATSWNSADYLDYNDDLFAGRPNTYGMRWANAVIQQSDLVISIGARLGLQQTGFAWKKFIPVGQIAQVDIDIFELNKSNPGIDLKILADAGTFLDYFCKNYSISNDKNFSDWVQFISSTKKTLPIVENENQVFFDYANPFKIVNELGVLLTSEDQVIPCSSGGAYTSIMQAFPQKKGQLLTNNKALASMGYGLAGAIGTALAHPEKRTILIEGDGGFAQNISELGTAVSNKLNIKIFIFSNGGYASIRLSQKAFFGGTYIGCDSKSGLQLPDWEKIFESFEIPTITMSNSSLDDPDISKMLEAPGLSAFIVRIHEDQPFLPKVISRLNSDGSMDSNPIHLMYPPLEASLQASIFRYLKDPYE